MKKKLLLSINSFGFGGAEIMFSMLACNLNTEKFDIIVICKSASNNTKIEQDIIKKGIKIIYLNSKLGFSLKTLMKINKLLKTIKPDIIHTHLSICIYFSFYILFHKVKSFHTLHSIPQKELPKIHKIVMRFMYKIGKTIPVAISDFIMYEIKKTYNYHKDIPIIYNAVDIKRYEKALAECDNLKNNYNIVFINVAGLRSEKNQKMLINAFHKSQKLNSHIRLNIVGEGEKRAELEENIRALNLENSVNLLGLRQDIPSLLVNADVFILSSLYEGLPLSVLEAMAAGLPIISTNVGGVCDVVSDNGILTENNNVTEMVNAIIKLAEDKNLRDIMSKKSLAYAKKYDIIIMAKKYEELYLT